MKYSGISVEILEGGTTRVTVTVDFMRSEQIEAGDIPALEDKLREWAGEDTSAAKSKPSTRGRKKADDDDGEEEKPKTRTRSRGRPKKDEEPEDNDDDDGEDEAPRKRAPRKKRKSDDDDEISDEDLVKAVASAMEELEEAFESEDAKEVITEILDGFGVTSVGKLKQDVRQEFLDKLKETVEYQLSDDD